MTLEGLWTIVKKVRRLRKGKKVGEGQKGTKGVMGSRYEFLRNKEACDNVNTHVDNQETNIMNQGIGGMKIEFRRKGPRVQNGG